MVPRLGTESLIARTVAQGFACRGPSQALRALALAVPRCSGSGAFDVRSIQPAIRQELHTRAARRNTRVAHVCLDHALTEVWLRAGGVCSGRCERGGGRARCRPC